MPNTKANKSTKSLRERIYSELRDDITYGKLSPGERLVEKDLSKRFKASRSPIREALRQLESEGFIRSENYKGISVSKLSMKQIDEIYGLRSLLESYATRLSAEKVTKNDVAYLRNLNDKMKAAVKAHDSENFLLNNVLFHDYFCENAGDSTLAIIIDLLRRRIYRYRFIVSLALGKQDFKDSIKHHDAILRACEKKDALMAENHMKIHLEKARSMAINHLRGFPGV